MRQGNLLCLKRRFKPVTTNFGHGLPVHQKLVEEQKGQDHRPQIVSLSSIEVIGLEQGLFIEMGRLEPLFQIRHAVRV
jgi:hypothetical protein